MRTVLIKIMSTLLGTVLLATSNWMWAEEPDPIAGAVPQACQDVRDSYPSLKKDINQSCVSVREALTQAQQACNGFWDPYCLTPCDQTPPTTGGPKDAQGQQAHADLCAAKQALADCQEQRTADRKALKQWASEICCPFWPCFLPTCPSIVGTWAVGLDLNCDGSTDVNRTVIYYDNFTWIGVGFPNGGPWSQQSCKMEALDTFFNPPIIWTATIAADGNSLSGGTFSGIFNGCWTATRISTTTSVTTSPPAGSSNFYEE